MGVPIAAHTPETAARRVIELALQHRSTRCSSPAGHVPRGTDVHLCNAYTLALADRDPELHGILRRAPLNLPDGQPVVWANRLTYREARLPRARVCGPDLFLEVFALGQAAGIRHYLLGSTPQVMDALQQELRRRFPQARIVRACSPPFRPLTVRERRDQERDMLATRADIVWVGLGTPKQDIHAAVLASGLPVVCAAVGAAFDFVAGHKQRAPHWMRSSGLEWIYRLVCEPRRLWRRYLFGNARFLWGVARQAIPLVRRKRHA
jgi:N-acetylglucosaminyldiphosphoundecaprenol N-acetyl-beta-D-mannosaminyltransferase